MPVHSSCTPLHKRMMQTRLGQPEVGSPNISARTTTIMMPTNANTQKEIDFVVNDADRKIYIQSAFRMDTEQKTASELDSLLLTKDFFKKIIVRMDIPHNFYDENGIFHCNLIDLLLGRVELF